MRGFLLSDTGDIVIKNGNISLVEGDELTAQKVRTVMGTNKGEWFMNKEEGIDFNFMLGKGITDEMRLAQCKDGLGQVDEGLYITEFDVNKDNKTRKATVNFKAQNDNDTVIVYSEVLGEETNIEAASRLAQANVSLNAYRAATERLAMRVDGEL